MARGRDYAPDEHRESGSWMPAPERAPNREIPELGSRGGGQGSSPGNECQAQQIRSPASERSRSTRRSYPEIGRDRALVLRESEIRTLAEIGTFRTLALDDLATFCYSGDRHQAASDVRSLTRQGLLRVRTAHTSRAVYLALSRNGLTLLKRHLPQDMNPNQVLYARFVKPRELKPDANLYRLYQEAAARIAHEGGRIQRVVLDFELKKSVYRQLAKLRELPESEQAQRRQQVAQEHSLTVVSGKIPLPDLRIEYETADREQAKVDLELATSDYHRDSLAEKARAGFAIFAMREDAAPLRRAIADPELTRDIFSI
jgi:hypothetical protein